MNLSFDSYLKYYISHPQSYHLKRSERIIAVISTIALAILTLGILPFVCLILQRNFKWKPWKNSELVTEDYCAMQKNLAIGLATLEKKPCYSSVTKYQARLREIIATFKKKALVPHPAEIEIQSILEQWQELANTDADVKITKELQLITLLNESFRRKASFKLIKLLAQGDIKNLLNKPNFLFEALQRNISDFVYNILDWAKSVKTYIDWNVTDHEGNTYLHYLVEAIPEKKDSKQFKNLQFFITSFGSQLKLKKNKAGKTPLDLAELKGVTVLELIKNISQCVIDLPLN